MTTGRHTAPAPPAPGARTRPVPTTRGHLAQLVGLGAAFVAILLGGFPGAVLFALQFVIS